MIVRPVKSGMRRSLSLPIREGAEAAALVKRSTTGSVNVYLPIRAMTSATCYTSNPRSGANGSPSYIRVNRSPLHWSIKTFSTTAASADSPGPGAAGNAQSSSAGDASSGSSHSNSSSADDAVLREKIIAAAMNHVPVVGWTDEAIVRAVKDLGMYACAWVDWKVNVDFSFTADFPAHTHKILTRGPVELVHDFLEKKRQRVFHRMIELRQEELQHTAADAGAAGLEGFDSVEGKRLFVAVDLHLNELKPYLPMWPRAIALMTGALQTYIFARIRLEHVYYSALLNNFQSRRRFVGRYGLAWTLLRICAPLSPTTMSPHRRVPWDARLPS
jgi:hypothetical protein